MRLGVVFPQTEIGADPGGVREFIQAAEELEYDHMAIFDHVLGADTTRRPGWTGSYKKEDLFHEPMVLFGYAAALTRRLELVTSVLVLGQRQTALVAKQAAEVDVLTGGRFRLGVGVGWNDVEYEALGQPFNGRGLRQEEQMEVMRALWTNEVVSFHGRWHHISEAGINPLPVQRPIPIWLGGSDDRLIRRVARMGDGWFPQVRAGAAGREAIDRLAHHAREVGRDPTTIGIEPRISIALTRNNPETWIEEAEAWKELGATHLAFMTMRGGLQGAQQHIDAIRRFKEAMPRGL